MLNKFRQNFNTPMIVLSFSLILFCIINVGVSLKYGILYGIIAGLFSTFITVFISYEEFKICNKIEMDSKKE